MFFIKGVVQNEFIHTSIYHAGKTNYSTNYHRALVAFYLNLQPNDMYGLKLPFNNQTACPWETPGRTYKSDAEIRAERSHATEAAATDAMD